MNGHPQLAGRGQDVPLVVTVDVDLARPFPFRPGPAHVEHEVREARRLRLDEEVLHLARRGALRVPLEPGMHLPAAERVNEGQT